MIEDYINISNDGLNWNLEISDTIESENWFDISYPDPAGGSLQIIIDYTCEQDTDSVTVMNPSFKKNLKTPLTPSPSCVTKSHFLS